MFAATFLRASALLVVIFTSIATAKKTFPGSTTCDKTCQDLALTSSAWIAEQQSDPTYSFYKVPSNFSNKLSAGLVLKTEDATNLTNYVVPSGLTMSRIIYTTEDINGDVVPASAYVLWPYTSLTGRNSGLPMVAWAHGTTGTFKPCAPSNYRALQYHFQVPFALALQGIAVVAPDYAGLGVGELPNGDTIPHTWLAAPAHANDVAFAVTAARSVFPDLLSPQGPLIAMGHSQGGAAAWAFAERQAKKPLKGYKGTVSIAPVTRILDDFAYWTEKKIPSPVLVAKPAAIDSISKLYPDYNYTGLTATGYDRWHNVLAKVEGCFPVLALVTSGVEVVKHGWYKDPTAKKWADRVAVGRKAFAGPLLVFNGADDRLIHPKGIGQGRKAFDGPQLVLNGADDHLVRSDGIGQAVKDTCRFAKDSSLEHVVYSAMDHFSAIQAGQLKWMDWIKDRLSSKTVGKKGCSSEVVQGLRKESTVSTGGPNFFLSFFGPQESWKYSL